MPRYIFVVQTNAAEGRDDEYNDWYNAVHIPDALAVAGFVAAQRFRICDTQRGTARSYPYRYMTIYEMEGDPTSALQALEAAVPGMHITSAMDEDRMLHVFESVTGKIHAPNASAATPSSAS
jgi:hypothetical protein